MDVGALTPPLWGFEEREKLIVFERASGARLHANYFRPGGVHMDVPQQLIDDIAAWCDPLLKSATICRTLFIDNRIFKQRNVDIGVIGLESAGGGDFPASWCAALARHGICARRSPMNATKKWNSIFRSAATATITTGSCVWKRCANRSKS